MKSTLIFFIALCIVKIGKTQFKYSRLQLLDSMEVLASVDGVICNSGAWKDSALNRFADITRYIYNLTYRDSKMLMADANNVKKAHGFLILLKKYPDDVSPDLEIFSNKDSIKVYFRLNYNVEKMTLGNFCNLQLKEKIKNDSLGKITTNTYNAIYKFINDNAKYPESFKISNNIYLDDYENDSVQFFGCIISYALLDNKGVLINEKSNFFILDKNNELQFAIKPKNKNYIISEKLKKKWLLKYGK